MPEEIYEVIALGARYWFALLGGLIVWRSFRWLRKDRRAKHRRLRQLPDAGMVGEMVVLAGSDELPEGMTIPVPREGTLGFVRTCDMVVPVEGVAKRHLDFSFRNGVGLVVYPWRGCACVVDGQRLTSRDRCSRYPMHHGSRLEIGDAVLRLRVFAGLETARSVTLLPDPPEEQEPREQSAPAWPEGMTAYDDSAGGYPPYGPPGAYPPYDPAGYPNACPPGVPMAQGYPPPARNQPPYPPQSWQPDWTAEEDANLYAPPEGGTDDQPRRHRGLFGRGRAD